MGDYTELDSALLMRIGRGELFNFGSDYLSTGYQLEWSPLVDLYGNFIFNLHDESGVVQIRTICDVMTDVELMLGVNFFYGARGSEFGGIAVQGTDTFLGPGNEGYVRVSYYF